MRSLVTGKKIFGLALLGVGATLVLAACAGDEGARGPAGSAGSAGPAGGQGAAGAAGPQGVQGDRGPVGLTGIPGRTGSTGKAGPQGAIGPAGPLLDVKLIPSPPGPVFIAGKSKITMAGAGFPANETVVATMKDAQGETLQLLVAETANAGGVIASVTSNRPIGPTIPPGTYAVDIIGGKNVVLVTKVITVVAPPPPPTPTPTPPPAKK